MSETKTQTRFFYIGWLIFFILAPFDNTSVGIIILFCNSIYETVRGNRRFQFHKDRYFHKIALFILIMLISSAISIKPEKALLGTLGFAFILYVVSIEGQHLIREKHFLYSVLIPAFLFSTTASALYVTIQHVVFDVHRGHTIYANPNRTGAVFALAFAIGLGYLGYLIQQKNKQKATAVGIGLALIGSGISSTLSRGAWLGVFASSVFTGFKVKQIRKLLTVALITAIVIIAFAVPTQKRLMSIFSLEKNMNRIIIWKTTLKIIADHPIFGIGTDMFATHWSKTYHPSELSDSPMSFAHNIILQITAEFGIPGLIVMGMIIVHILKTAFKSMKKSDMLYTGLTAAFIGAIVHEQFDCIIYSLEHTTLFWLIATLLLYLPSRETDSPI